MNEPNPMRFFIVEDEPEMAWQLARMLARRGHRTLTAADGPEAVHRLRDISADAVLLDLSLPGLDGLGVLQALAEDARPRAIPVLVMTDGGSEATIRALCSLYPAVRSVVTKPVTEDALNRLIRNARLQ